MAEVVAFINQNKVTVFVSGAVQNGPYPFWVGGSQEAHGQDFRVEVEFIVIALPHLLQGLRTDDQGAYALGPHKMFKHSGSDIALPQANHIGHKGPSMVTDHLNGLANGGLLKIGKAPGQFIIPQYFSPFAIFKPVGHQRVNGLHVNVIWSGCSQRPGLLQFFEQNRIKLLGFIPQHLEPFGQPGVVVIAVHYHV